MFVLGVGAATLSRAQQTGDKAVTPARARSNLRERVVALRTEIDLLQLDFEADRATLVDSLKEMRKVEQPGGDDLLMEILQRQILQLVLEGDAKARIEMSKALETISKEDMKKVIAKSKDDVSKGIERTKKEFAKKARFLNEKKLELEETQAKYTSAPKS